MKDFNLKQSLTEGSSCEGGGWVNILQNSLYI
jgi:hypothetical protein